MNFRNDNIVSPSISNSSLLPKICKSTESEQEGEREREGGRKRRRK
jgi:hypothetical protein